MSEESENWRIREFLMVVGIVIFLVTGGMVWLVYKVNIAEIIFTILFLSALLYVIISAWQANPELFKQWFAVVCSTVVLVFVFWLLGKFFNMIIIDQTPISPIVCLFVSFASAIGIFKLIKHPDDPRVVNIWCLLTTTLGYYGFVVYFGLGVWWRYAMWAEILLILVYFGYPVIGLIKNALRKKN